jgi:hypothetical protein
MSVFASTPSHSELTSSVTEPVRASVLLEQSISAEVVRRLAAHRLDTAIAVAETVANGSDEQGDELGHLFTPAEFVLLARALEDVLTAYGVPRVEA